MKDRVEVSHHDKGYLDLIFDIAQLGEERLEVHTVFKRCSGGTLDDRAVGQRVAERDSDLDEVDTTTLHGENDIGCAVEGRTACAEIKRQEFLVFGLLCKEFIDLICHNSKMYLILQYLLFRVLFRSES